MFFFSLGIEYFSLSLLCIIDRDSTVDRIRIKYCTELQDKIFFSSFSFFRWIYFRSFIFSFPENI